MKQLPDKPSELIRLALGDLVKCENDPNYKVNMDYWHTPHISVCLVCFAGSVLAQTCEISRYTCLTPGGNCDDDTAKKLLALNQFRQGNVHSGLVHMGVIDPLYDREDYMYLTFDVPEYRYNKDGFKKSMDELADFLEKNGF